MEGSIGSHEKWLQSQRLSKVRKQDTSIGCPYEMPQLGHTEELKGREKSGQPHHCASGGCGVLGDKGRLWGHPTTLILRPCWGVAGMGAPGRVKEHHPDSDAGPWAALGETLGREWGVEQGRPANCVLAGLRAAQGPQLGECLGNKGL